MRAFSWLVSVRDCAAAHLRAQFAQHVGDGVGHALAYAGCVRPAGKVEAHGLCVAGIDHQGARVARVAELVAADGQLMGEGLGQVGSGFGAVAVVIDANVHIKG